MSPQSSRPAPLFLPPAGVRLKDPSVNIRDIDAVLQSFLVTAGLVHLHLFDEMLTVVRGRGDGHTAGDAHVMGRAVDLQTYVSSPGKLAAFLICMDVIADRFHLTIIRDYIGVRLDCVHIESAR